jgi:hypothetical protein
MRDRHQRAIQFHLPVVETSFERAVVESDDAETSDTEAGISLSPETPKYHADAGAWRASETESEKEIENILTIASKPSTPPSGVILYAIYLGLTRA